MIGLDTNVLIRILADDRRPQRAYQATMDGHILERRKPFVPRAWDGAPMSNMG